MSTTILQISKHGWTVDIQDGDRRCHVRVFEFETQPVPNTAATCEMPVTIDTVHAVARLRQAQEALRESLYAAAANLNTGGTAA